MQAFEARMNERKLRFLSKTLVRIGEIENLIKSLGADVQGDQLEQVNKHFHQLAGSAGIYELSDVCAAAIAGEDACIALISRTSALGDQAVTELLALCEALRQAVVSAEGSTGTPASQDSDRRKD